MSKSMNFRIASFDLGIHHLPVVVEEVSLSDFAKLRDNIPAGSKWFDDNNLPKPNVADWLDQLTACGRLVYVDQRDFAKDHSFPGQILPHEVLISMRHWIRGLTPLLSNCQLILIEQQVNKNPLAQRIEQHLHTLLLEYLEGPLTEDRCRVYVYPSRYKTHVLGAPKKIKSGTRLVKLGTAKKQWAEQYAQRILVRRREISWLDRMRWMAGQSRASSHRSPKLDDQADCLLMIQSSKILILKASLGTRPNKLKKDSVVDVDFGWLERAVRPLDAVGPKQRHWSHDQLDTQGLLEWMGVHTPDWTLLSTRWWNREQPLCLECPASHQIWLNYPSFKHQGWRCLVCQPSFISDQHLPILGRHLGVDIPGLESTVPKSPGDQFFSGVCLSQFETRHTPVYCPAHDKIRTLTEEKIARLRLVHTRGRRTKCWCE